MSENKEFLEEAIKHFKSLQKRYTREHNGKMCEKVAVALEAMEKQVPKKPKPHEDDEFSAKCPNCYDEVDTHWVHGGISYCPFCGQAIDWSDT